MYTSIQECRLGESVCTLAIACSAVIALGVDLDRPQEGVLSLWRAGSRRH